MGYASAAFRVYSFKGRCSSIRITVRGSIAKLSADYPQILSACLCMWGSQYAHTIRLCTYWVKRVVLSHVNNESFSPNVNHSSSQLPRPIS